VRLLGARARARDAVRQEVWGVNDTVRQRQSDSKVDKKNRCK
jgi:hypothetical protein